MTLPAQVDDAGFIEPLATADLYDPIDGNWTSTANLNIARAGHTATLLANGKVLVAGGHNEGTLSSAELYNPGPNFDNPIDDAAFFVRQQYLDFLNREPDPSGLSFWSNLITSCGGNQKCVEEQRVTVSAAFFLSIEFQNTGYLAERIYKVAYGDAMGVSTIGGLHQLSVPIIRLNETLTDARKMGEGVVVLSPGWQELLERNKQTVTEEFVHRERFTNAFPPSLSAVEFVDKLNANAGGFLSQSERNSLVSDLSSGMKTRAQVLRAVAEQPDFARAEFNRAFVLMQYFGYLRRNPNDLPDADYSGYDFWLTKLNAFEGNYVNAEMVKAFLSSIEYRQRFGP